MGTSQSSKGSPSGVPMLPPWTPDTTLPVEPEQLAPRGRFGPANRCLGDFARHNDRDRLKRGVGHYIQRGLGGSSNATRRMGGTIQSAGSLGSVLYSLTTGDVVEAPGGRLDPALLQGADARTVIDAVIEAVCPSDGTLDREASRESINDALSEVLVRFPDADLLTLSSEQREFAIQEFLAQDVYRRFQLDVGDSICSKAPTLTEGLSRLRQAKDYIHETIESSIQTLRDEGRTMTSGDITALARDALKEAFDIFEGWA